MRGKKIDHILKPILCPYDGTRLTEYYDIGVSLLYIPLFPIRSLALDLLERPVSLKLLVDAT